MKKSMFDDENENAAVPNDPVVAAEEAPETEKAGDNPKFPWMPFVAVLLLGVFILGFSGVPIPVLDKVMEIVGTWFFQAFSRANYINAGYALVLIIVVLFGLGKLSGSARKQE